MNGYLLDTNVISEYNREETPPHPGVVKWIEATPETLQYLSVLTLGEIEKGILLLDEGKRRREIKQWFENDLQARFAGRILAIDSGVASMWARFIAPLLKQGRPLPTIDSLLAATALANDLTFVTRNVKHFAGLQVPLLNPWA
jgi:predicted nucleic acid-binding protein